MGWNGQGELVCPLRGQSLESRLAAQPSVMRMHREGKERMAPKSCPQCRLLSDPAATICDCGYEFATGTLGVQRAGKGMSQKQRAVIADTADRYRGLVAIALVQALLGGGGRTGASILKRENPEAALVVGGVSAFMVLLLATYAATRAYGLATEMALRNPGGWATTVLVGGILGVMIFNTSARQWSEKLGIRFGLLGPNRQDIERFARGHGTA